MSEDIFNKLNREYARTLAKPFYKAVEEYRLFNDNDSICVCISGGKDSMLLSALFREYERHGKTPISVKYLTMDAGFSENSLRIINQNAEILGIDLITFKTDVFKLVENEKNPCFLCSKMRRGLLYKKAKELGCSKIALGHHFDDVIESILMGMLYGGQAQTMLPRVKAQNFEGMELIRPMYFIREKCVSEWADSCNIEKIGCDCALKDREDGSKRAFVKQLIANLSEENPQVEMNIFRSVQNVRLDRIMSYKDESGVHSFLDRFKDYDEKN